MISKFEKLFADSPISIIPSLPNLQKERETKHSGHTFYLPEFGQVRVRFVGSRHYFLSLFNIKKLEGTKAKKGTEQ